MAEYNDQGFVIYLAKNEVLVVGTNLAGEHHGGAARQAHEDFDLEWGVGEGLSGNSYAFPTLHADMTRLNAAELLSARDAFYRCVTAHPNLTFIMTKVGCGIANIPEEHMAILFRDVPKNVIKPAGW